MNGTSTCPTATAARLLGKPAVVGVKSHCIPPSVSESKICTRGMEMIKQETPGQDPKDPYTTTGNIYTIIVAMSMTMILAEDCNY